MNLQQNHIYVLVFNLLDSYGEDFTIKFKKTTLDTSIRFVKQIEFDSLQGKYFITYVKRSTLDISVVEMLSNTSFCGLIDESVSVPLLLAPEKSVLISFIGGNYFFVPIIPTISEFDSDKIYTLTPAIDYTIVNIKTKKQYNLVDYPYNPTIINNEIIFAKDDLIDMAFGEDLLNSYRIYVDVTSVTLTGFAMVLYQNSAENNRVDKDTYLNYVGALSGTLRTQCSMINPSISIEMNSVPNFNYVWIPAFNRYYFVTSITSVQKDIWNIDLAVDVLMSYKQTIYSQSAEIERQEFDFNPDLVDAEELAENEIDYIYIEDNTGEKIFGKNYNPDTQSYTDEVKPSTRSYVLTYYKGS